MTPRPRHLRAPLFGAIVLVLPMMKRALALLCGSALTVGIAIAVTAIAVTDRPGGASVETVAAPQLLQSPGTWAERVVIMQGELVHLAPGDCAPEPPQPGCSLFLLRSTQGAGSSSFLLRSTQGAGSSSRSAPVPQDAPPPPSMGTPTLPLVAPQLVVAPPAQEHTLIPSLLSFIRGIPILSSFAPRRNLSYRVRIFKRISCTRSRCLIGVVLDPDS